MIKYLRKLFGIKAKEIKPRGAPVLRIGKFKVGDQITVNKGEYIGQQGTIVGLIEDFDWDIPIDFHRAIVNINGVEKTFWLETIFITD